MARKKDLFSWYCPIFFPRYNLCWYSSVSCSGERSAASINYISFLASGPYSSTMASGFSGLEESNNLLTYSLVDTSSSGGFVDESSESFIKEIATLAALPEGEELFLASRGDARVGVVTLKQVKL